jgi:hypothetical protein
MTRADVEAIVLREIAVGEQRAGCVGARARIVAMAFVNGEWQVRAEGTFTTDGGASGAKRICSPTGHLTIHDADGSIVGYGFP